MRAHIVQGMAFGDESKGRITDLLVRQTGARLVVRFNGGPQAAHNVVSPEGLHHTFSQVGSGTLAGAATHLSRFMLVEPFALWNEIVVLREKGCDPVVTIDPSCVIVTPYHRILNRARERSRGANRHGSVGLGVGEARRMQIDRLALAASMIWGSEGKIALREIKGRALHELGELPGDHGAEIDHCEGISPANLQRDLCETLLRASEKGTRQSLLVSTRVALQWQESVIFEGAQGVLLDETYGFAPYNSWTDCTFRNADTLLDEVGCDNRQRIGVFRTYFTRHGAGPFVTEDASLGVKEPHNAEHPWMGGFRVGHFDSVLAQYAVDVAEPDVLAITHCDQLPCGMVASQYEALRYLEPNRGMAESGELTCLLEESKPVYVPSNGLPESIELWVGVPVAITTHGPQAGQEKILRKVAA